MHDFDLQSKLAAVEADLVSAAAHGERSLMAEMQTKLCELQLDDADRDAILSALSDSDTIDKAANFVAIPKAPGGGMLGSINPKLMRALTLGTMVAGPLAAGAQWFMKRRAKDQAWQGLQSHAPELVQADPQRAQAMFDLIHSTAPNIARNPSVTKDLMTQMMDMPMVDLGTVSSLARAGKDLQRPGEPGLGKSLEAGIHSGQQGVGTLQSLVGPKTAALLLPVRHVAADGTPCVFDWSTDVMKQAGITDAFTGGGTMMQQADNAMQMSEEQKGLSLLPLDAVVRELLTKEQELAQREQILAQQEQELQQALSQMQGMGGLYQDQYGVSPEGQELPEEDPSAFPDEGMPEGGEPGDATPEGNGPLPGGDELAPEEDGNGFPPGGEEPAPEEEGNGFPPGGEEPAPEEDGNGFPPGGEEPAPEEDPQTVPPGEGGDPDGVPGGEQEADDPTVGGTEEADTTGFPPEAGHPELAEAPEDDDPVSGMTEGQTEEADDGDPSDMEGVGDDAMGSGGPEMEPPAAGEDGEEHPEMGGEEAGGGAADPLPAGSADGGEDLGPLGDDQDMAGEPSLEEDMGPADDTPIPPGLPAEEGPLGGPAAGPDGEPGIPAGPAMGGAGGFTVRVPLPSLEVTVKMAEEEAAQKMSEARKTFASTVAGLFRP